MYYYSLHSSLSVHVFAQDVTIDGLGYSLLSDGTAYVSTFQDATLTGAITIPSSITSDTTTYQVIALGNNCFDSCTKITSVKLPVGIKYLGDRCFYGCSALESCNISNTVIEIGNGCFVKYIDHAFPGGINLEKIICHWTSLSDLELNGNMFQDVPTSLVSLLVPKGTSYMYKSTFPWSEFGNVIEQDSSTIVNQCELPSITYKDKKLTIETATEGANVHYDITL